MKYILLIGIVLSGCAPQSAKQTDESRTLWAYNNGITNGVKATMNEYMTVCIKQNTLHPEFATKDIFALQDKVIKEQTMK